MNRPSPLPCASALSSLLLGVALAAQSNTITGLDAALTDGSGPTYQGRRGAAHPTGEIALSWALTTCNVGTANIQWDAPMDERHPFFAMAVVRLANGRPEQITRPAETYVKHGFGIGTPLDCGGTCQPTGLGLGMHCSDVYGSFSNANRFFLGPAGEIDPWLGDWVAVGSYFDRGDPDVGPPGNQDGVRSLLHGSGNFPSDPVKNRVTLPESEVLAAGRLFYCSQLVVRGEDGDLRADDLGHRELAASYAAPDWTFADVGTWQTGSVLESWPGATVGRARNGDDDGHFVVAVVATDLGGGQWHYEYAVHDVDNARGGAALRVPLCPTANAGNFTFRDTDDNPLNDWTAVVVGGELAFQAAAGNALEWNNIFN
ncbi:MAG: hypothetical protein KDE27_28425, partial [Planctomycetes bacterium]|nr:hypothetical protein [Planctomycetota bacterium]